MTSNASNTANSGGREGTIHSPTSKAMLSQVPTSLGVSPQESTLDSKP